MPSVEALDDCAGLNGTVDSGPDVGGSPTPSNGTTAVAISCLADSANATFYSLTTDGAFLYVGQQDGSVLRMDPRTGAILARAKVGTNAAAILLYYLGSLYVGEDTAPRGLNRPPFHIYRVDPATLTTIATFEVRHRYACGILVGQNGAVWSGDGGGDFIRHDPRTLAPVLTGPYAEDNILFDGSNFWTQLFSHMYDETSGMRILASGDSPVGRPTGFFLLNGTPVFSDTSAGTIRGATSHFYTMRASGSHIVFHVLGEIPLRFASPKTPLVFRDRIYLTTGTDQSPTHLLVLDTSFRLVADFTIDGTRGQQAGEASPTQTVLNETIYFPSDSWIAAIPAL